FDPAYVHRLFAPFERLHLASEFEGNGIGLALVKSVAQRHGGRVQAQAQPGAGALITISLSRPVEPVDTGQPAPRRGGGLRILLVDDEPLVLATVEAMLERDGHE